MPPYARITRAIQPVISSGLAREYRSDVIFKHAATFHPKYDGGFVVILFECHDRLTPGNAATISLSRSSGLPAAIAASNAL